MLTSETITVEGNETLDMNTVQRKVFMLNYSGRSLKIEFRESGIYFKIGFSIDGTITFASNCKNYHFLADKDYCDSSRWGIVTLCDFIRRWGINQRSSLRY